MSKYFKLAGFIAFILLFLVSLMTKSNSAQEKEGMNMKGMMGEKGAVSQIDSMMAKSGQMMKQMMDKGMMIDTAYGKDTYKTYRHKMDMHKMLMSMQNMMQGMKDFMENMSSSMKEQEMMKDMVMKKNIQEMQETMEHMTEHVPGLMENMEGMIKRMEKKK